MELILASGSPRRKELLTSCGYKFRTEPSNCEEIIPDGITPQEAVEGLAYQKASDIAMQHLGDVIIGADTVVIFQDEILGKPKDKADAYRMLKLLSGQTHEVRTGVAILQGSKEVVFSDLTFVTFYELTDEEIYAYIETGDPMDKAGAYGIQHLGSMLVRSLLGSYHNVMGLPIALVARNLRLFGAFGNPVI